MKIGTFSATLAATSILRGEQLAPLGRVGFVDLQSHWGRYALRRGDFDASLRRLEARGVIEMEKIRGKPYVVLTRSGHHAIHSLRGFLGSLLTWPRRIQQAIQHFRRASSGAHLRRRSTDRGQTAPPDKPTEQSG
jgi:hypothetical protein